MSLQAVVVIQHSAIWTIAKYFLLTQTFATMTEIFHCEPKMCTISIDGHIIVSMEWNGAFCEIRQINDNYLFSVHISCLVTHFLFVAWITPFEISFSKNTIFVSLLRRDFHAMRNEMNKNRHLAVPTKIH